MPGQILTCVFCPLPAVTMIDDLELCADCAEALARPWPEIDEDDLIIIEWFSSEPISEARQEEIKADLIKSYKEVIK